MRKIKVFFRLGKRPHPSNYEIIDFPPKGIIYKYPPILRSKEEDPGLLHRIKVKLWLKYIRNRPPIIKIFPQGCDVIHTINSIMNSGKTPWVMDLEHVWALMSFNPANLKNEKYFAKVHKILSSEYCKKLLAHTEASRISAINNGFKDIESKIETVYLTKRPVPDFKKPKNKVPIILWMGRRFWEKGGNTVLEVFNRLDGKADFKMIVRGPVPEDLKRKYIGKKNIEIYDTADFAFDKKWSDMYKEADIFLYPTNLDSFGNAFLDAMNYKVPIVTDDLFSAPELVEDGVNGFVVKHPMKWHNEKFQMIYPSFDDYIEKLKKFYDDNYFSELAEKVMILIKNRSLREKMGRAGRNELLNGKFSIKKRNERLYQIYKEAAGK